MKIHVIQTAPSRSRLPGERASAHGRRRLVHAVLDRRRTEPLPIYAFAIEHPEGVIVVDTGETARASQPGYFPSWHPVFRLRPAGVGRPEQEIGPQLERLGIRPGDVRCAVLTHMHTDHAGGLHHFPDTKILVTRAEMDCASGRRGRLRGYPNAAALTGSTRPCSTSSPSRTGRSRRASADRRGRRQGRPAARPHPRSDRGDRRGRRPRGPARRRQLLHPGPCCAGSSTARRRTSRRRA